MLQLTTKTNYIQKNTMKNKLVTSESWGKSKQLRKVMALRSLGDDTIAWLKEVTCNAYVRRMFSSIMSCL
jgi:hypothetical protein